MRLIDADELFEKRYDFLIDGEYVQVVDAGSILDAPTIDTVMTNIEYLCKHEPTRLAMALIKESSGTTIEEAYDGTYVYAESVYTTTDGQKFAVYDDALKHELEWMAAERTRE